jgi:hypothetical protein
MTTKPPQEETAARLQAELIINAIRRAATNDGIWLNADRRRGAPAVYPKGSTVSPFNALILGLHADENKCRTTAYASFSSARANCGGVLAKAKGVPFNWYNWSSYANRTDPLDTITREAYLSLPEETKKHYKGIRSREIRYLFNADHTNMNTATPMVYEELVKGKGAATSDTIEEDDRRAREAVRNFISAIKENMLPVRRDAAGIPRYDNVRDTVFLPSIKNCGNFTNYAQSLFRSVVTATGHSQRLAREGVVMEDTAVDAPAKRAYERLVADLASGVKMQELGLAARMSPETYDDPGYWEVRFAENPNLIDAIESDVNCAVDVLRRAEKGERIEYESRRNRREVTRMPQGWDADGPHEIADSIASRVDRRTRHMVIVKDWETKTAEVIIPGFATAGDEEAVRSQPGFARRAITGLLKAEGYETVTYYNKDGMRSYRPHDAYFEGRKVEVCKLSEDKNKLHVVSTLDVRDTVSFAKMMRFDRIQAMRDDNGKWFFYIKPRKGDGYGVHPDREDLNRFFTSARNEDRAATERLRLELGNKYHARANANPAIKFDPFPERADGETLRLIDRVSVYKLKSGEYECALKLKDGTRTIPRQITDTQWKTMWSAADIDDYKRTLAARLFADVLSERKARAAAPGMELRDCTAIAAKVRHVAELKEKFPDKVILVHDVTGYWVFGDDTEHVSRICSLPTELRRYSDTADPIRTVTFPRHMIGHHLPELIRDLKRVVISEHIAKDHPPVSEQQSRTAKAEAEPSETLATTTVNTMKR